MNMNIEDGKNEMREYLSHFEIFRDALNGLPEPENRIDEASEKSLEERMIIVGEKYEDELKIIDRGGLNYDVSLGEFDREYNDSWGLSMKLHGDDGYLECDWRDFHEFFLERCFLRRIHKDFQYPLVRYLELFHDDHRWFQLDLEIMKSREPDEFYSLSFSDEMKENWEPLVKLLRN